MIEISIVIPTHNRRRALKRCLECLFNQDYPKDRYEIIIVDDGSTDGTREEIDSLNSPCRLIYLYQSNRGPHLARNLGLSKAEGEIILFIDSDILVPPPLIREHMRLHREDEKIIVSGPLTCTTRLDEDFRYIERRKFLALFDLSGPSLITSNLSVRREYLLEVGGFDEDFEGYGWHDWEMGYRLKGLGLRVRRNREAIVYHLNEGRFSSWQEILQKRYERGRNAILYLKKHPEAKILLSISLHFFVYDWLINFWESIFRRRSESWTLIQAYVRGLRDGLHKHEVSLLGVIRRER